MTTLSHHTSVHSPLRLSNASQGPSPYITPESVANITLATLMAVVMGLASLPLDFAGYEIYHLINHESVNINKVEDDSFLPKIGAVVFGVGAWFVFLKMGLGKSSEPVIYQSASVQDSNAIVLHQFINTESSHWKARAAMGVIFLLNTLFVFAIEHFVQRHLSMYLLAECLVSKSISAVIVLLLCAFAIYSGFNKFLAEQLNYLHISIQKGLWPCIGPGTAWHEDSCIEYTGLSHCWAKLFSSENSRSSSRVAPINEEENNDDATVPLLEDGPEGNERYSESEINSQRLTESPTSFV